MNVHTIRYRQSGNVLFYVLIAVALLAALSYAIAESSRGNVQRLSEEKARLVATEILEYATIMANAVGQLRLRGFDDTALCFDDPGWGADDYDHGGCADNAARIFHPEGGGLSWSQPPSDAMDVSATPDTLWHIYGDNEVEGIGTTCAASTCADLLLVVDELDETVCIQINDLLNVTNPSGVPPTDSAIGETRFTGAFGYTATIADEAGGSVMAGKNAACFQKTSAPAEYTFYKVLASQ